MVSFLSRARLRLSLSRCTYRGKEVSFQLIRYSTSRGCCWLEQALVARERACNACSAPILMSSKLVSE